MAEDREMITGKQGKAAREMLGWSRPRLSARAAVSDLTIQKFEEGHLPADRNIVAIRRALQAAGIEFIDGEPLKAQLTVIRATWDPPQKG
jgi:ribosome-binding protein aMBF1 (putative translation factor)